LLGSEAKYISGKHTVRRYFPESIKNKHLAIRITSVLSVKGGLGEYAIMIISRVIYPIIALIIAKYCVQLSCKEIPWITKARSKVSLFTLARIRGITILEARRCLWKYGSLLIVETTNALAEGRLSDLRNVLQEQGFEILKEEERDIFTFVEAIRR
jgi:hypothetical protein